MRISLTVDTSRNILPLNYNYSLSAAIYKLLRLGSPEFSSYLHNIGFRVDGRSYKLFSFALRLSNYRVRKNAFELENQDKNIKLYITTPLSDDFMRNFIIGSFKETQFALVQDRHKIIFEIKQMEAIPEPKFKDKNKFVLYSPLVLSTKLIKDDKPTQHFLRYYDDISEINRVLNNNLINKYKVIYNKQYEGEGVKFEWDYNYIKEKTSKGKRPTKLIKINKPGLKPINVIGNEIPFFLSGDEELIKIGYDCGFGEKNSMGFGFAVPVE